MNKLSLALVLCLSLIFATDRCAQADLVYVQFEGSNAAGNVSGSSFSGASWFLEYAVDDTVSSNGSGFYVGNIVDANLVLDGATYELIGGSELGNISLNANGQYHAVSINPATGGFMQFLKNTGDIYPLAWSNVNDFSSANLGTTMVDDTTDSFNNSSILSYQGGQGLQTAGGDLISIFENSGAASGNFRLTVSGTSGIPTAVPEPVAVIPVIAIASGLLFRRRR